MKKATHIINTKLHMEAETEKKKQQEKEERISDFIDLVCYCLFMFFFTLNTCDGLGDSSFFRFSSSLGETLHFESFSAITDASSLNQWLQTDLVPALYSPNFVSFFERRCLYTTTWLIVD
jgi:hypothetical protein